MNTGPSNDVLKRVEHIITLDKWCSSESGQNLYMKYFTQTQDDESNLSEIGMCLYLKLREKYMTAKQKYKYHLEKNIRTSNKLALNFLNTAEALQAFKMQYSFKYPSLSDFHHEQIIQPQLDLASQNKLLF